MTRESEILEILAPGRMVASLLKEDVALVSELIGEEPIVSITTQSKGLTSFIAVLTSERLLLTHKSGKEKAITSYSLKYVENLVAKEKFTTIELQFTYHTGEQIDISLDNPKLSKPFVLELEKIVGYPIFKLDEKKVKPTKKAKPKKPITLNMNILNGESQLSTTGKAYELLQEIPGEVLIKADRTLLPETYSFIKWERVENVQKSALDIAGWTAIGSAWGNKGAIAGAMGANVGRDKSVATLYLKAEHGEKIALIIKCNKKDLEKLSLFILAEEEKEVNLTSQPLPVDDLKKLKELVDAGLITEDEFTQKKKVLLGI